MKIQSSVEVVVNLGNYQHLKAQVSAEDKARPGEAPDAAYARVNALARTALRENVEALTAQLDDWQREEALKLIGVNVLQQRYESENQEDGDAVYNILSAGFVDDDQEYRIVYFSGPRLLLWSDDVIQSWSWELDGGEIITGKRDHAEIVARFPVGTHFVTLRATTDSGKTLSVHVPILVAPAAPVVEKAVDVDAILF